jgi:AraC family transcriptional regulator
MVKELNEVIEFIEAHLTENPTLGMIADYAGVSDYHFRKIFFYLSKVTLSEYIKNRKLSEASKDLLEGLSVTEVAFKYGYQSLDGFTRAFKQWCGVLPSEIKKRGIASTYPKLFFAITVRGGNSMEFRIEEKPKFNLFGVTGRVPMQFEGINHAIVALAQGITEDQRAEMHSLQNIEPREVVNASYEADANFLEESGDLTHLIGVLSTENRASGILERIAVSAGTWAVFPNEGPFPATLQDTMAKIYSQWFPGSGYEIIDKPNFSFTRMNPQKEGWAYSEIWIPVEKGK